MGSFGDSGRCERLDYLTYIRLCQDTYDLYNGQVLSRQSFAEFGIGLGISLVLATVFFVFSIYVSHTTVVAEQAALETDQHVPLLASTSTVVSVSTSAAVSEAVGTAVDETSTSTRTLLDDAITTEEVSEPEIDTSSVVDTGRFIVPFYSQFTDITPVSWRKIGCGIASLAMLIDYYKPAVAVDSLLEEGIANGAYIQDAGWSHAGLINLAKAYGLRGAAHSYAHLGMTEALATLQTAVAEGPVMVSVHYTFDPQNPIPHLVVVTGVHEGKVYYNDPAETSGDGSISIEQFQSAWKQRHIEIRA